VYTVTENDYRRYDIPINEKHPVELDVTRLVGWNFESRVFLDDNGMLTMIAPTHPTLHSFIALHDWYHPDIAVDEMPSATTSFKQLGGAMSARDRSVYRLTGKGNTHWRNWASR